LLAFAQTPGSSLLAADGKEATARSQLLFTSLARSSIVGALVKSLEEFKQLKLLYKLKVSKSSKLLKAI